MTSRRWWALGPLVFASVGGRPGRDDSQRRPADARSLAGCVDRSAAVVRGCLYAGLRRRADAGRDARRPLRPQEDADRLPARFGAASIACALAPSADAFIAARRAPRLGGAIMLPMVLGLLPVLFDETERPRAIGAITAAVMLGYPIGPLLGGWMLTKFDWSWVFLINLPVVAVALVAVTRPATREPQQHSPADRRRWCRPLGRRARAPDLRCHSGGDARLERQRCARRDGRRCARPRGVLLWERRVAAPLVDLRLFRSASSPGGQPSAPSSRSRCSDCCSRGRSTSRSFAARTRRATAFACSR